LTMNNIAYTALPHTVAYPAPVAPPATPVIPAGATSAQINEAVRNHQEEVKVFNRYFDTDRALVRLIIAATPDTYIKALLDPMFGYANVTTLSLLTHLKTTYGEMTAADREANLARMNAPWSPPSPIENLFDQLEEGQRYAVLAAEPIADSQLTRLGLTLITKCGMMPDGCREWRLKPAASQTWANFKIHFALHDRDRQETATAASSGYSGAVLAVQPIAPPVVSGAPLDSSIAALAATVLPSGAELVALLTELAKFRAAATNNAKPTSNPVKPTARGYCWTHGSTTNSSHSSATCRNKAPGHIDTATWRNKQGGNATTYVPPVRRAKPSE
jgi:hypothetical protein